MAAFEEDTLQASWFDDVARLPADGDNVAVATRRLEAGTLIRYRDAVHALDYTVLEGHRFAVAAIPAGAMLRSWGRPFGLATQHIAPFSYVSNRAVLDELGQRFLDFERPAQPNFQDHEAPYVWSDPPVSDTATAANGGAVGEDSAAHFLGYRRRGGRGAGTRNTIVLLGTSARTSGFVQRLAERLQPAAALHPGVDGIVAVAHTEGGHTAPNNGALVLRTLAGFMVHPNVGAVLAVDDGMAAVNNQRLQAFMAAEGYPLAAVNHHFMTLAAGFEHHLHEAETLVHAWLPAVARRKREPVPLHHLRIALQCGGSDAFSGISGNPLAAWGARRVIEAGGAAVLAETDELVGAEAYVLAGVRRRETAHAFLATIDRFRQWAGWHGVSVSGNPSGGNRYRGLYNITLKSLGAAMKKPAGMPLNQVLNYGERTQAPGFHFMDSPGNDLESIAGQVACGCNLIYFITGNGSITNFPFVPTLKIVTTTARFQHLAGEMDVNAGAYLDGVPMDALGRRLFAQTLEVASGARTRGEAAGHAQVQIWRDWRRTEPPSPATPKTPPASSWGAVPSGKPLPFRALEAAPVYHAGPLVPARDAGGGYATQRIGLIVPTSLCAGQVSRLVAAAMNKAGALPGGLDRIVALVHTEGCGVSGTTEAGYVRTLLGYLRHPNVACALLLEHGCEITHNDYMRHALMAAGERPERFGWAGIQAAGGLDRVRAEVVAWFEGQATPETTPARTDVPLSAFRIGVLAQERLHERAALTMAAVVQALVQAGGTVITTTPGALFDSATFWGALLAPGAAPGITPTATLGYGQPPAAPGLHVMQGSTDQATEAITGLGACGVHLVMAWCGTHAVLGHPFLPVLQVTEAVEGAPPLPDMDFYGSGSPVENAGSLLALMAQTLAGEYPARLAALGNTGFQIARAPNAVSL